MGFDSPAPGLMERKPRPLSQPVLSRGQWMRIIFIGLIVSIGTLILEYLPLDAGGGDHDGVRRLLALQHHHRVVGAG